MSKIMKNPVFMFILGALICGTTGVIASNLMASNVTYTPSDTNWGVNNVEAAIDSLKLSKTSDNYSTDEKVVGTWIDGKPLYQKTFQTTVSSSSDIVLDSTLTTSNIYFVTGWATKHVGTSGDSWDQVIPINGSVQTALGSTPNGLIFRPQSLSTGNTVDITVQYTKNSDTAN